MERLLFKFYKSYFDVASELSDKDRLLFYDALMNKQFNGIEPTLIGMSKFAYISQKHSIDAQVKGWEDKMGIQITPPTTPPTIPPTIEEKEEVKEKEKKEIDEIYNLYPSKCPIKNSSTGKSLKDKDKIKTLIKSKPKDELISTIEKYILECSKNKIYMKNFSTFLNNLPDYSIETKTEFTPSKRMVHYKMYNGFYTHYEKTYLDNLKIEGQHNIEFLNYVD